MNTNLARYESYIAAAKQQQAQIMVLPEYGLQGWPDSDWTRDSIYPFLEPIPSPSVSSSPINPCAHKSQYPDSPITIAVSCLAKKYNMALVLNYGDVEACVPGQDGCRSDGRTQYNTAVAFDELGNLLVRYHKRHLYFEDAWYDVDSDGGHKASFTTQFGVTFGVFICFDVFWEISETLTDFAYPTYWDNSALMNATITQILWSEYHRVNFLAANIGTDNTSSGSGIYTCGTPLAEWMNNGNSPVDKLLVATLPVLGGKQ